MWFFFCFFLMRNYLVLRFKYTITFSLPKIACPAIVYAISVVFIGPFFVCFCPWIKVYRYNPTKIWQRRLQGVRNVAQKLCPCERSFNDWNNRFYARENFFNLLRLRWYSNVPFSISWLHVSKDIFALWFYAHFFTILYMSRRVTKGTLQQNMKIWKGCQFYNFYLCRAIPENLELHTFKEI